MKRVSAHRQIVIADEVVPITAKTRRMSNGSCAVSSLKHRVARPPTCRFRRSARVWHAFEDPAQRLGIDLRQAPLGTARGRAVYARTPVQPAGCWVNPLLGASRGVVRDQHCLFQSSRHFEGSWHRIPVRSSKIGGQLRETELGESFCLPSPTDSRFGKLRILANLLHRGSVQAR